MYLEYYLRLALVCLTVSVVGCFPELSIGDTMKNPKIKNIHLPIQNSGTLQRKVEQFNSKYQRFRISSSPYRQRSDAKNPSFSPSETRASADVPYYRSVTNKVSSNVNSRNNPVELSSGIDAKRSYAFQIVQQEHNPLHLTRSQKSSSDINLAPSLVNKEGLVNGMHAGNAYRSGSFGYQHISKSEMHSGSSRPLRPNEPYLRENISVQPVIRPPHAERIPSNDMSRSWTVNHNSVGNSLFDQNNGLLRRVIPASMSLSTVRANQPLIRSTSQISNGNMRDVSLSKVLKPLAIPTPEPPLFKRPNLNRGHEILPFKKALMFSSQRDPVKQSDSKRFAIPKANTQSSFDFRNIKLAMKGNTFKNIQLAPTQNVYPNMGQSGQNAAPMQTFHTQNYDNLAAGMSAMRPLVTNEARSYKEFLSDENHGIQTQMHVLPNQSTQGTYLTPRMQFLKNTMLFLEHDTKINLPDTANHLLRKPSQHNTQNRTHLNYSVQSLFVNNHPVPCLVPGNKMKSVHSVSPSVSHTQEASRSRGQNRPYYLTSKKPYAFKGFAFAPTLQTSLQKTEMQSQTLTNSLVNVQHAPARPRSALTQKLLIPDSYEKTLFQFKDIDTSEVKQPDWGQTGSFDIGPPLSSTEGARTMLYDARGQAVAMKASLRDKNTESIGINNRAFSFQSYPKVGYGVLHLDDVHSKPSSSQKHLASAHNSPTELIRPYDVATIQSGNSRKNPTPELILPIRKSSLMNKVSGNAVIRPLRRYNFDGTLNSAKEIKKDRNSSGVTQSNARENYIGMSLRPTSSVVIGRRVELTKGENANPQNIYSIPIVQSAIYRSTDTNSSAIKRPAISAFGNIPQANIASDRRNETTLISKTEIDLSAVGVSQALRPTSSFVVGRYVNKASAKSNLNMSSTKTGLINYKPVWFSDIAGSASFTNVKPPSADTTASLQNHTDSTPASEEATEIKTDNSSRISTIQAEDFQRTADLNVPGFIPTVATDISSKSQLSFTEEYTTIAETTVCFSEPQLDHTTPTAEDPVYEGTLIPNSTLLLTITSD